MRAQLAPESDTGERGAGGRRQGHRLGYLAW